MHFFINPIEMKYSEEVTKAVQKYPQHVIYHWLKMIAMAEAWLHAVSYASSFCKMSVRRIKYCLRNFWILYSYMNFEAYLINSLAFWKVEISHFTPEVQLLLLENTSQKEAYYFWVQNLINRRIKRNCHLHKALNCIFNFDALLNSDRLKDDLANADFGMNFELKCRK